MNKFNLTFRGEILPGKDPEQVKTGLGELLGIDDPVRLEQCFGGEPVILESNLERKKAAELYSRLQKIGADVALAKIADPADESDPNRPAATPSPSAAKKIPVTPAKQEKRGKRGMLKDILLREPGQVDQSWAVGSGPAKVAARPAAAKPGSAARPAGSNAQPARAVDPESSETQALTNKEQALEQALRARQKEQSRTAPPRELIQNNEADTGRGDEIARRAREKEQADLEREIAQVRGRKLSTQASARREAELAEANRLEAEAAAKRKQQLARLKQEEEAAAQRHQAELAEVKRKEAQAAARLEAELAEAKRKSAQAEARREADLAKAKRREAEAEARRQAELAEVKRKKAEAEAKRQAELAETKRKEAEAETRRKAELAEIKRKEAEAEARRKAELAQIKRKEAEAETRRKAELAEIKRKEAEAEARRKAELAQIKRKEAEAEARHKAELAEIQRKEAEAEAQRRAKLDEAKRKKEAEEAARRKAERAAAKRKEAEAAARRKAELAEAKRKKAEEAALRKAQQQRKKTEEAARRKAQEQLERDAAEAARKEQVIQLSNMEEQAIRRATAELSQKPSIPAASRTAGQNAGEAAAGIGLRKHQPGKANLFSLRPFRNTPGIKARAEQSHRRARIGFGLALIAATGLLILGAQLTGSTATTVLTGASAIAIDPQGGKPVLLAGDQLLLHDRSGSGTSGLPLSTLGVARMSPPLAFNAGGELFAPGVLVGAAHDRADNPTPLLRCRLSEPRCQLFSTELTGTHITALAINPLDDTVFIADAEASQLLKVSAQGKVIASADIAVPQNPVLRLDSGLLLMNSVQGPAISVFRYENNAFGRQLDEILLLLPANVAADFSRVSDFLWNADSWWVTLHNPDTANTGLYRFDSQWKFLGRAALPAGTRPQRLSGWGQKTLVLDSSQLPIQRFGGGNVPEVPLVSDLLTGLVDSQQRAATNATLLWQIGLAACALLMVIGLYLGILHRLRGLVYKSCQERGAQPIDDLANDIDWVDPASDRDRQLRQTSIGYAVLSLAFLLLAVGLMVSSVELYALLLALAGPAIALVLLYRSEPGHIGIAQGQLLLVDHTGMYHLGAGARIHYRGHFLMIDDVAVFTGNRLFPVFSPAQVRDKVMPLATEGIRVDRGIVLVKLLQNRHPLAVGALATAAALVAALVLLALQGVA